VGIVDVLEYLVSSKDHKGHKKDPIDIEDEHPHPNHTVVDASDASTAEPRRLLAGDWEEHHDLVN
jgi:hypothetical protein